MYNLYKFKNWSTYITQRIRTEYKDKKPTNKDIVTQAYNDNILLSNYINGDYTIDPIEFCDTYKDVIHLKSGNICSNLNCDNFVGFLEVDLDKNYYAEQMQFNSENAFVFYKNNKAINSTDTSITSNYYNIRDTDYYYNSEKEVLVYSTQRFTKSTNKLGFINFYNYKTNNSTYLDYSTLVGFYVDYRFPNDIFALYCVPNASFTIAKYTIDDKGDIIPSSLSIVVNKALGTGTSHNGNTYFNLIDNGDNTYDLKIYYFGNILTKTVEFIIKDVFNKCITADVDELKQTVALPYYISKIVDFRHFNNLNPNNCLLMLYKENKYYYTMYNFTSSGLEYEVKELGTYNCILTDNKYTYFNDKYNTNNVIVYAMNTTLKKLDIFVYNFDINEYVLVEKHQIDDINTSAYFVMGITCNNFYTINKNYDILYTSLKMYSNIYDVSVETNETEKNITITVKGFDNFTENDKILALKFYKGLYDLDYVNKTLQLDSGDSSIATITITQLEDFNTKGIVSEEVYNKIVGVE